MASIKCGVTNCYYNADGNCNARSIQVKASAGTLADSSSATFCETFRPAEQDKLEM